MIHEKIVYIIDDDGGVRESIAAIVEARDTKAVTYGSAEDFLAAYQASHRGCLIIDVRMEGIDGLQLQEQLASLGCTLPVILLTGYADVPMAVRAMQAGALTFLEKPISEQELWQNIEQAFDLAERDHQRQIRRTEVETYLQALTPAEHDVLAKLMDGKPNKIIASELDLGLRTVELRRSNIMKKMHADSLAELVRLVLLVRSPDDVSGTV